MVILIQIFVYLYSGKVLKNWHFIIFKIVFNSLNYSLMNLVLKEDSTIFKLLLVGPSGMFYQ